MLCSFSTHHHTLGASRYGSRGGPWFVFDSILVLGSEAAHRNTKVFKPNVSAMKNVHGIVLKMASDS